MSKLLIEYDENCEMIAIRKEGKCLFEGNYWDVPKNAQDFNKFLNKLGVETEIKKYKFGE